MSTVIPAASGIHPDNYRYLQQVVYEGSGIVLDQNKDYLLDVRLSVVARQHGLGSVNDLCALLRGTNGTPLRSQVVEAMTTNETYFYREPTHYDLIRTVLLPQLRDVRAMSRKLSFWSAASSSGQESYSLAMMLIEQGFAGWNTQILGTDLSTQIIDTARAGRYRQIEVNRGLPTPMLLKYFRKDGVDWQLKDDIRNMVKFQKFDLRSSMMALGPFDLVFCRNVLIYFDSATRRKILSGIHGTLFRGGWLLLSTTEVASEINEYFERQVINGTVVYVANEIGEIAGTVFQTMLGIEISPAEAQWSPDPEAVVAQVHLTGTWNGAVMVETSKEQACELAGAFLSCPAPPAVDSDVRDVIGELANMIGGNLKSTIAHGAKLSPPQSLGGLDVPAEVLDRQAFSGGSGLFWVSRVTTQPDELPVCADPETHR